MEWLHYHLNTELTCHHVTVREILYTSCRHIQGVGMAFRLLNFIRENFGAWKCGMPRVPLTSRWRCYDLNVPTSLWLPLPDMRGNPPPQKSVSKSYMTTHNHIGTPNHTARIVMYQTCFSINKTSIVQTLTSASNSYRLNEVLSCHIWGWKQKFPST